MEVNRRATPKTAVLGGGPDHRDSVLTEEEQAAADRMLPCVPGRARPNPCSDFFVYALVVVPVAQGLAVGGEWAGAATCVLSWAHRPTVEDENEIVLTTYSAPAGAGPCAKARETGAAVVPALPKS